jgi:hypothetical protein
VPRPSSPRTRPSLPQVMDLVPVPDAPEFPQVDVPETRFVEDATRSRRLREILRRLAQGQSDRDIVVRLSRKYQVKREQIERDIQDVAAETQRQLDSEDALNATVLHVLARNRRMSREFFEVATEPLPNPAKEGGLGLTPVEQAATVATKIAAAKLVRDLDESAVGLLARRSKRWSPKPAVSVSVDAKDLTPEQQEAMRRLMGE